MTATARRLTAACLLLLALAPQIARAADDDPEPMDSLHAVHTKHYTIHTDIDDGPFVDDIGRRMDVMYDQYAKALADFKPKADAPPLPVFLFATRDKYMVFTRGAGVNTAGVFAGGGKHSFLASFLGGQGRDELRRTLQHEAFHQFAYFTVSRHLPIWLNEGMAQVFEEGIWTGKLFLLGQVPPRRIRQLRLDVEHHDLVPFDKFLVITHKQWSDNLHADADRGATYYNEAWAVAHFLTQSPNKDYRKRCDTLLHKLHAIDENPDATADPDAADSAAADAFHAVFPKSRDFQQAFDRWAVHMRATPESTLLDRQETLGDFLAAYQGKGTHFDSVDAFRDRAIKDGMRMRYRRGAVTYDTDPDVATYFADLNGGVYPSRLLFFAPPTAAEDKSPLPDLICWPAPATRVRTHFYTGETGKLEHEVAIDPVEKPAKPVAHAKPRRR